MAELGWKEAIVKVLEKSAEPMHYTDITQAIATEGLKSKGCNRLSSHDVETFKGLDSR